MYLFLHYFYHIMKHISLSNMHMNNISTVLYDCLQQLEYRNQHKTKWICWIVNHLDSQLNPNENES